MRYFYIRLFLIIASLFSFSLFVEAQHSTKKADDFEFIRNLFNDHQYQYVYDEGTTYLKTYDKGAYRDQVLFYLAQIDTQKKRYKSAIQRYKVLLNYHPNSRYSEDALYYLGILLIDNKKEHEGQVILTQLKEKFPTSQYIKKAGFTLGQLFFKQKNWKEAEKWFLKAIKVQGSSPVQKLEARRFLAWIYYFQNRKKEAHKWFVILLNVDLPKNHKAEICNQLALDQRKAGHLKKAIFWYTRQLKQFPDPRYQNNSRFWIAELTFQRHKDDLSKLSQQKRNEIVKAYTDNLALSSPVNAETSLYHRALIYYHQNQLKEAERDFKELQTRYTTYNSDPVLTLIRADINYKLKKWPESIQLIDHLFQLDASKKEDHLILLNLAKIHDTLSNTSNLRKLQKKYTNVKSQKYHQQKALQLYKKAYETVPLGDPKTSLALIDIITEKLKITKSYKKVIFYYKEALSLLETPKEKEELKLIIAKTYLIQLKNTKQAHAWLSSLVKRGKTSNRLEAAYLLGELYISQNKYSKATQVLEKASQTKHPGEWHFEIIYRLAEIYHFQENWKQAVRYYQIVTKAPKYFSKRKDAQKSLKQITAYLKSTETSPKEK